MFEQAGFAAVVNLTDGAVRKLPVNVSLAYYDPGCGAGEQAVLTQRRSEPTEATRLVRIDTQTGRIGATTSLRGQFTNAEACGDPPGINGLVADRTAGDPPLDGDNAFSQQSFHPNEYGYELYARVVAAVLGWPAP